MTINYRIAEAADLDTIYAFAEDKLRLKFPDQMELMMAVWESRFRKEALEHYLKLGWSFLAYDLNNQVHGFFLGQPLLFFQGRTQTLWVEYILANSTKIQSDLADIAIKLSRDKHLQEVVFPEEVRDLQFERNYQFNEIQNKMTWVKTTK